MSNTMLFWVTTVSYAIITSLLVTQNKRLDKLESMLRDYFYKIDYHSLDLILKNGDRSNENPPNSSKDSI